MKILTESKSQSGFTVLEVILAGSIGMVTMLGLMTLTTANTRSALNSTAVTDFTELVTNIQRMIDDGTNCKNMLGAYKLNAPATAGAITPALPVSPLQFSVTGTTGPLVIAQTGPRGTTLNVTQLEINYSAPSITPNQYFVKLHLAADKLVGGSTTGLTTLNHDFSLVVTIDPAQANRIVGCAGEQDTAWKSSGSGMASYGNVTINGNLHVTGNIYSDYMGETFTVGGTSANYCPVLFIYADRPTEPILGSNSPYPNGVSRRVKFEIFRDNTHESISNKTYDPSTLTGDFRLIVSGNGGGWGHTKERLQYYYYQPECATASGPLCDPVGDVLPAYFSDFIVIYLKGGATYHTKGLEPNEGPMLADPNPTCGTKTINWDTYPPTTAQAATLYKGIWSHPQGINLGPNSAPNSNTTVLNAKMAGSGPVAVFSDTTTNRSVTLGTEQGGLMASFGVRNNGQLWDFAVDQYGYAEIAPAGSTGLYVYTNGDGWLRGNLTQGSDERLKQDIVDIPNALAKVDAIPGIFFNWKDKELKKQGHQIGVLAQTVQKEIPELVHEIENPDHKSSLKKVLTVNYRGLSALVLQAVRELYKNVRDFQTDHERKLQVLKLELAAAETQADQDEKRAKLAEQENAALEARIAKLEVLLQNDLANSQIH